MGKLRHRAPLKRLGLFVSFVKLEHSVFALPFAYAGAFLARNSIPGFWTLLWITLAMVAARSLAMGLNRLVDYEIDARNPRTAGRELPSGRLSARAALAFLAVSAALLAFSLYHLPRITWYLLPIVIAAFVIYPFTKRFTYLCHIFLGATIGLAPVGGWVAVTGELAWQPFLLMGVVTFWIAGFDIIYACLDIEFDRREGLYSLPAAFGPGPSLWVTRVFHGMSVILMLLVGREGNLGWIYLAGVIVCALLLAYENSIVSSRDLTRVNTAFMTMNGIISVIYIIFLTLDIVI